MAKLIVLEGLDGCGKATQTKLLADFLRNAGCVVKQLSFPDYGMPWAVPVEKYLRGELDDDDPKVAALLYAYDRYCSYRFDWSKDYADPGTVIIADRYVLSNKLYQGSKLAEADKLEEFWHWIDLVEHEHMGLPKPDLTIWLDVPPEIAARMRSGRPSKHGTPDERDIHEENDIMMHRVYELSKLIPMERINCVRDGSIMSPEDISARIILRATKALGLQS